MVDDPPKIAGRYTYQTSRSRGLLGHQGGQCLHTEWNTFSNTKCKKSFTRFIRNSDQTNLSQSHTQFSGDFFKVQFPFFIIRNDYDISCCHTPLPTFNVFKYSLCSSETRKLSQAFWIALLCVHGSSWCFSITGSVASYCFARAVAKYQAIIILR